MWNEKSRKIAWLESEVVRLKKIVRTNEHAVVQSKESIGNEVAAQIAVNRNISDIIKQLSMHYTACPSCQEESFLRYDLEVFHYSDGSWEFTTRYNYGPMGMQRPYSCGVDLTSLKKIVKATQQAEYSCWHFDLYRCVRGHEWIELTDRQQKCLNQYIHELKVDNEVK